MYIATTPSAAPPMTFVHSLEAGIADFMMHPPSCAMVAKPRHGAATHHHRRQTRRLESTAYRSHNSRRRNAANQTPRRGADQVAPPIADASMNTCRMRG